MPNRLTCPHGHYVGDGPDLSEIIKLVQQVTGETPTDITQVLLCASCRRRYRYTLGEDGLFHLDNLTTTQTSV